MSENVSEAVDFQNPTVVEMVLNDKELQDFKLNSEELKAAVGKKLAKTSEASADPVAEEQTAEGEAEESEGSDDESEAKQPVKKNGWQKRVDKLTKEREALRREVDALRGGAANTPSQEYQQAAAKQVEQSTYEAPKPKLADFQYDVEAYHDALTDWKLEKREHDRAATEHRTQLDKMVEEKANTWTERENAFKASVEDYDGYVNEDGLKAVNPTQEVLAYIAESEVGPQLAYEILSNEDTIAKFKALPPYKQIGFLAKLEARFETSETEADEPEAKKPLSKAPTPPRKLASGAGLKHGLDPIKNSASMSFEEWDREVDKQLKRKR